MELRTIRIKNFRSIAQEQILDLSDSATIVGSNSTGKTNLLKAIEMFFTGVDNVYNYKVEGDFPFSIKDEQTSLIASFSIDELVDKDFIEIYNELNGMLDTPKEMNETISLYLNFSKASNPYYNFFPNEKRKKSIVSAQFSKKQLQATKILLNNFICHYVPSSKSINELYEILLLPFIKKSISNVLQDKLQDIQNSLNMISNELNTQIKNSGILNLETCLEIPANSIEGMLSSIDLNIKDNFITSIDKKGMGIQATTILSSFYWITEEEKKLNKKIIWLIEEPESYLHPALVNSCYKILNNLRDNSKVIITTHALGFIGQNPKQIIGTSLENGFTKTEKFDSYQKATESIRRNLGVRFSDFYNLAYLNVFVEGKSDREVFTWALDKISESIDGHYKWEQLRKAKFLDFTGTSSLEAFLSMTYEFINRERVVVAVFDGDDAGIKAVKALQSKFGNQNIGFQSNKDYVLLPNKLPMEALFPHEWIIEISDSYPNRFESLSKDIDNKLAYFRILDKNKEQVRKDLMKKAEDEIECHKNYDWAVYFIKLFDCLNQALIEKEQLFLKKGIY